MALRTTSKKKRKTGSQPQGTERSSMKHEVMYLVEKVGLSTLPKEFA
jgi:hypothetical protein